MILNVAVIKQDRHVFQYQSHRKQKDTKKAKSFLERCKKDIDKTEKMRYNITCEFQNDTHEMEKYSRGRRGAPAKGVGRDNRRESSNLSFSAKKVLDFQGLFSFSQLKNPLQSHTDIKITISHTGSTQKCVLFLFSGGVGCSNIFLRYGKMVAL